VQEWVDATSTGFIFHFKAFGIFCGSEVLAQSIPYHIRQTCSLSAQQRLSLATVDADAANMLWADFNDCLDPVVSSDKMGCVIFQFHLSFSISQSSKEVVEASANRLRTDVLMAVEFRNRGWLGWPESTPGVRDDSVTQSTLQWLKSLRSGKGVILIASDELVSETYPHVSLQKWEEDSSAASLSRDGPAIMSSREDANTPAPPTASPTLTMPAAVERRDEPVLPTLLTAYPCSSALYVRIHRREGTARVLSARQIQTWANRITAAMSKAEEDFTTTVSNKAEQEAEELCGEDQDKERTSSSAAAAAANKFQGPCYVLWGTDYEDQPIANMALLQNAFPPQLRPAKFVKYVGGSVGGITKASVVQTMFQRAVKPKSTPPIEESPLQARTSDQTCSPSSSKKRSIATARSSSSSPAYSSTPFSTHTPKKAKTTIITSFFKKTSS
jgi:uncharacterized protein YecE (DUF72 family)